MGVVCCELFIGGLGWVFVGWFVQMMTDGDRFRAVTDARFGGGGLI